MNLYIELACIWIILIAVGSFIMTQSFPVIDVQILGKILVVLGVIVFIVWIVKLVAQFIKT